MARYLDEGEDVSSQNAALAAQKAAADKLKTEQGLASYNAGLAQQNYEIKNGLNGFDKPGGSGIDKYLNSFTTSFVENIPVIYGALLTAGAAGAFGGAAGGAAGGAGGAAGGAVGGGVGAGAGAAGGAALGDLSFAGLGGALGIDTAALGAGGAGWAGLGGAAGAGLGAGAAAGAAGAALGSGSIPQVIISGAAGGAGGGIGLGAGAAAGGLGLAGLGNILGNNPTLPINHDALQQLPDDVVDPNAQQVQVPGTVPPKDSIGAIGFPNLPTPAIPYLPVGSVTPGSGNSGTSGPGLGDILGGLGSIGGAYNDYQNSKEDSAWWKSQLDTLEGMYKPGTPEAELMRQKMEAQDAATGRRSQYGVRSANLAADLASKRAGIMTSAGYQNMANAYRDRDSQSLNSLFAAMGSKDTQSLISSIGSGIGSLFSSGTSTAPTR